MTTRRAKEMGPRPLSREQCGEGGVGASGRGTDAFTTQARRFTEGCTKKAF